MTETSRWLTGIYGERKRYLLDAGRRHFSERMGQIKPHLFFVLAKAETATVGTPAKSTLNIVYCDDGH